MANPLKGEVAIEVGGERKTLVLDFNTFCEIEAETDLDIPKLAEAMQGSPSATLLRTVFWACLQDRHPGTLPKDAGRIMSELGPDGINDTLTRLFTAVMPKADPANPPKPPAKKASRGGASSRS